MQTRNVYRVVVGILAVGVSLSAAGSVSGTVSFNSKGRALTVTPKFVAYVTGPDDLASGGVKAALTFDAPRLKAFSRAR
ncbi:MAG TPA: hypothetical protein VG538_08995 [Vicinamibacterales bacterium]|jgi:hypothetical protein|nr:hypothetical protein [Vicinamibacterales bacterium]